MQEKTKEEIKELVEKFAFAIHEDAQNGYEKDLALRLMQTVDLPRSED